MRFETGDALPVESETVGERLELNAAKPAGK
jgi:hypothetical protein